MSDLAIWVHNQTYDPIEGAANRIKALQEQLASNPSNAENVRGEIQSQYNRIALHSETFADAETIIRGLASPYFTDAVLNSAQTYRTGAEHLAEVYGSGYSDFAAMVEGYGGVDRLFVDRKIWESGAIIESSLNNVKQWGGFLGGVKGTYSDNAYDFASGNYPDIADTVGYSASHFGSYAFWQSTNDIASQVSDKHLLSTFSSLTDLNNYSEDVLFGLSLSSKSQEEANGLRAALFLSAIPLKVNRGRGGVNRRITPNASTISELGQATKVLKYGDDAAFIGAPVPSYPAIDGWLISKSGQRQGIQLKGIDGGLNAIHRNVSKVRKNAKKANIEGINASIFAEQFTVAQIKGHNSFTRVTGIPKSTVSQVDIYAKNGIIRATPGKYSVSPYSDRGTLGFLNGFIWNPDGQ